MQNRPHLTVILAMTADGKIADYQGSAARFGSANDKAHLERQVSDADGILFGAGTLRAYGTTMSVSSLDLLQERQTRGKPSQPVQIVVSASGNLNSQWRFFQQSVPRWLVTTSGNDARWLRQEFERIIIASERESQIDWRAVLQQLSQLGLHKLAVLGGGELIASLLAVDAIDELWLTLCPVIFGGNSAPTPVGGQGWLQSKSKKLRLLEIRQVEQELFLHYSFEKQ